MTFQVFGTAHLQNRRPEQDVIDRIDELVDWEIRDSPAAVTQHGGGIDALVEWEMRHSPAARKEQVRSMSYPRFVMEVVRALWRMLLGNL